MAKRPPSNPSSEADLAKTVDPVPPMDAPDVGPVAMAEPSRPEADPVPPELWTSDPVTVEPAVAEPAPEAKVVEPVASAAPVSSAPVEKRSGGGFVGTALGGVVAAAAGYALAIFVPFPGMGTSDAPAYAPQADVQALAARVETLEAAPVPDPTLAERIAALEAQPAEAAPIEQDLTPLTDALAALDARVASVEAREPDPSAAVPTAEITAEVEALRAQIAEIQAVGADANAGLEELTAQTEARLAEAEEQAAALRAEAEATAQKAVSAAALGRVQAALESGAPFAGALTDLGGLEIPETLSALAETGVPSRAALADAFPAAARAALEASLRADMGEGWADRLATFLQTTTGARSLTPQEGTDPDAVLSRAEAAVRAGDFAQSLAELQGLPPEGQAEMAEWSQMAQQRVDAITAVAALSAAVEG